MNDEVRQINLTDEELANRLLERFVGDHFAKPLIAAQIAGHREGDPDATKWIRQRLGWESWDE